MKAVCLAAALCATATLAPAQELVFGAGVTEFKQVGTTNDAYFAVEYHATPFYENGSFALGLGGVASVQAGGDVFLGGGLVSTFAFSPEWSLEASIMPGAYFENSALTDLGDTLEFRSLIGLAYQMKSGDKISLALAHKSNAGLGTINPGSNTLMLRWHKSF